VPDAESIEPRFEFDWLAKAFGDLDFLNKSLKGLNKLPPPFFFDFFVAMEVRGRKHSHSDRNQIDSKVTWVTCHHASLLYEDGAV
jgi:hypothetical protein